MIDTEIILRQNIFNFFRVSCCLKPWNYKIRKMQNPILQNPHLNPGNLPKILHLSWA